MRGLSFCVITPPYTIMYGALEIKVITFYESQIKTSLLTVTREVRVRQAFRDKLTWEPDRMGWDGGGSQDRGGEQGEGRRKGPGRNTRRHL